LANFNFEVRDMQKSPTVFVRYLYDAAGNRVMKRLPLDTAEYIVRDVARPSFSMGTGNELERITRRNNSTASPVLVRTEASFYGSTRLGTLNYPTVTTPDTVETRASARNSYEISDHLGNVRVTIGDLKNFVTAGMPANTYRLDAALQSANDYYPFGLPSRTFQPGYKWGFNGKENDREVLTGGRFQDYGFRAYRPDLGRFFAVDPLAHKFPFASPYAFCLNNPVNLVDMDGREPIKPLVGTAAMFRTLLDNSPSRVGGYTGDKASNYLKNLGNTEFSWKQMRPLPTETGFFNKKEGRYLYTEKGGWVDMAHFMFYAGKAYQYKLDGKENPVGEAVQDGYKQEMSDKYAAKHSAYSYEDLPSDKFGAEFGAKYFDPKSKQTFGEQLENYLNKVLKATDPKNAPNYEKLPTTEPEKPTRTNETTTPVYTKENK
jgi:RHS repeat-associated protein